MKRMLDISRAHLKNPCVVDELELDLRRMEKLLYMYRGANACRITAVNPDPYPFSFDFEIQYGCKNKNGEFYPIGDPVRFSTGTLFDEAYT